jgi:hypothetical protein
MNLSTRTRMMRAMKSKFYSPIRSLCVTKWLCRRRYANDWEVDEIGV